MKELCRDRVKLFTDKGNIYEISKIAIKEGDRVDIGYILSLKENILNETPIGYANITYLKKIDNEINFFDYIGHEKQQDNLFYLSRIDISNEYKNQGLGSKLMNVVVSDIYEFNQRNKLNSIILFEKENNGKNDNFYERFGAIVSDCRKDYKQSLITCMAIEKPKSKKEYDIDDACILKVLAKWVDTRCTKIKE